MHQGSLDLMADALQRYPETGASVLDVGAFNVNGSYREYIVSLGWHYTGLDLEANSNVDIVADNPYHYPIESGHYDIVISGSVAYAVLDLVSWMKELVRVMHPQGLLVIVTPSFTKPPVKSGPDLWRMSEEALRELMTNTDVLNDIRTVESGYDVCASAVRVWGEIDEPKSSPAHYEIEVSGGTFVTGEATGAITTKAKAKAPARKATKK